MKMNMDLHAKLCKVLKSFLQSFEWFVFWPREWHFRMRLSGYHFGTFVHGSCGLVNQTDEHFIPKFGRNFSKNIQQIGASQKEALDNKFARQFNESQTLVPDIFHVEFVLMAVNQKETRENGTS